jgi:serine/threonine-protein kinase
VATEVGRGGMAIVFAGEDLDLGRRVAIKVLKPELSTARGAQRFLREARTLANHSHPNIVPVHEVGERDGLHYFVMDFVQGDTLATLLKQGPLDEGTVRELADGLLDALAVVHSALVVHRDIKPANILLVRGRPLLSDFGIARVQDATDPLTREGWMPGTPEYMAPELAEGDPASPSSDLYALAAVLFESVTGRRWRRAESGTWKGVPPGLRPVLRKALADRPEDRYTDAGSFRQALSPRADRKARLVLASALAAALVLGAVAIGRTLLPEPATGPAVILVAPLEDLSPTGGLETLADGLNAEITTVLGTSSQMVPIGRITARTLQGPLDLASLREDLDVDYVLHGNVSEGGTGVRAAFALTSTADRLERWSDSFEYDRDDHLRMQEDVAWSVVLSVEEELSGTEPQRYLRHRTSSTEAFDAYHRARRAWERRRPTDLGVALQAFQEAVALDSTYALAWVGLADVYNVIGSFDYGAMPPRQAFAMALDAADRAIALQDSLGEAWVARGMSIYNGQWDLDRADAAFQRGLALYPGYMSAHQWYSILLNAREEWDQSLARVRRAAALDRRSAVARTQVARHYYFADDLANAEREYREAIELDADYFLAHLGLGLVLLVQDSIEQAMVAFREGDRLTGGEELAPVGLIGMARALQGDTAAAGHALAALGDVEGRYVPPEYVALVHLGLGERDAAVDSLRAAWRNGSNSVTLFHIDPLLADLHGRPDFEALLDSVGVRGQL